MKKILILLLALAFATTAFGWTGWSWEASVASGHGSGSAWGNYFHDAQGNNYDEGGYDSGMLLYDGSTYVDENGDPANEGDQVCIDLYIETFGIQTFTGLHYEFHVIPNGDNEVTGLTEDVDGLTAEKYCFFITMTVESNTTNQVGFTDYDGRPMDQLVWSDGTNAPSDQGNIHVQWSYILTGGADPVPDPSVLTGWTEVNPSAESGDATLYVPGNVQACDHIIYWRGCFLVTYHHGGGHWELCVTGCPAPVV
jgi:hypothetical protein